MQNVFLTLIVVIVIFACGGTTANEPGPETGAGGSVAEQIIDTAITAVEIIEQITNVIAPYFRELSDKCDQAAVDGQDAKKVGELSVACATMNDSYADVQADRTILKEVDTENARVNTQKDINKFNSDADAVKAALKGLGYDL